MPLLPGIARAAAGTVAVGAAGVAYALAEAKSYVLRRVDVPVLPPDARPLRVLHVSDLHVTPRSRSELDWVRRLGDLQPDLVVDTGDNLAHVAAVPPLLDALAPLLRRPGAFVPGSNDYFAPVPKNPASYLSRRFPQPSPTGERLPWPQLRDAFVDAGWVDLTNARGSVRVGGLHVGLAGTDDPHLRRDDPSVLAPRPEGDVAIGVTHAPYVRVLDAFAAAGYPLVLAGHTHGGQLCVPGWGALVTNCDLDTRRAKGLSHHPARAQGTDGSSTWLHVSAGLGTSPYTPVRFSCRPEATLLTLLARA